MKRSTKVALSLLVPAITAYGCSNNPTTVQAPGNGTISNVQSSKTIDNYPYRSRSGFFSWFGRSSSVPSTGTSNHNVSYGGFGSFGARFSGGS